MSRGMLKQPDGIHRVPLDENKPPGEYEILLGSERIGTTVRQEDGKKWRAVSARQGVVASDETFANHTLAVEWLVGVEDKPVTKPKKKAPAKKTPAKPKAPAKSEPTVGELVDEMSPDEAAAVLPETQPASG